MGQLLLISIVSEVGHFESIKGLSDFCGRDLPRERRNLLLCTTNFSGNE
jgi:hypothetical protein